MIRISGGYEEFADYISKNHKFHQKMLVISMIKSGESLEYVVDCLINQKRIKSIIPEQPSMQYQHSLSKISRRSISPGGSRIMRNITPTRLSQNYVTRKSLGSSPRAQAMRMNMNRVFVQNSGNGGEFVGDLSYSQSKNEILSGLRTTFKNTMLGNNSKMGASAEGKTSNGGDIDNGN